MTVEGVDRAGVLRVRDVPITLGIAILASVMVEVREKNQHREPRGRSTEGTEKANEESFEIKRGGSGRGR